MNNLIDFNEHLKNKNISKIENIKIYTNKEDINFEFTLLTDFVLNKLYINLKFEEFDINIDIDNNLEILREIYLINPLTRLNKKRIKEITELEDEFVTAIYNTYIKFNFINKKTKLINDPLKIANSYLKIRIETGYPKSKKAFDKTLKIEKEIFSKYIDDVYMFNDELYWKSKTLK